jgi:hypothetical protein
VPQSDVNLHLAAPRDRCTCSLLATHPAQVMFLPLALANPHGNPSAAQRAGGITPLPPPCKSQHTTWYGCETTHALTRTSCTQITAVHDTEDCPNPRFCLQDMWPSWILKKNYWQIMPHMTIIKRPIQHCRQSITSRKRHMHSHHLPCHTHKSIIILQLPRGCQYPARHPITALSWFPPFLLSPCSCCCTGRNKNGYRVTAI